MGESSVDEPASASPTAQVAPPSKKKKQSEASSPTESSKTSKPRRALIACRSCREKRSRCDGSRPCKPCSKQRLDCQYEHSERRVWISQTEYLQLKEQRDTAQRRVADLERQMGAAALSIPTPTPDGKSPTPEIAWPHRPADDNALRQGRGRLLTDDRGVSRYMGDSSGAAFYSAVMDILPSLLPPGMPIEGPHTSASYQTWDSRPLPLSVLDPYTLPPLHLAKHLISIFFQHCTDTHDFVDPAQFMEIVDALYKAPRGFVQDDAWGLAQFYMILAIANVHVISPLDHSAAEAVGLSGVSREFPGMGYFSKANVLLAGYPERSSMMGAQTLALVAFYLLSVCYRDAAYAYIGASMRMAISLGLHRLDQEVDEQAVRLFWTIYCLDRLISSTLGRPIQLANDDIVSPRPLSPGLLFGVRIASLQTSILSNLYVNAGSSSPRLYSIPRAEFLLEEARTVRAELVETIPPLRNPRSETVLKLACNQAIITVCRHALLLALRIRRWPYQTEPRVTDTIETLVREAREAAIDTVSLLEILSVTGTILPWCFDDCHAAYNAGMVLILASLLESPATPEMERRLQLILSMLEFMASKGNESAASCKSILECLSRSCGPVSPSAPTDVQSAAGGAVADSRAVGQEWDDFLRSIGMTIQ